MYRFNCINHPKTVAAGWGFRGVNFVRQGGSFPGEQELKGYHYGDPVALCRQCVNVLSDAIWVDALRLDPSAARAMDQFLVDRDPVQLRIYLGAEELRALLRHLETPSPYNDDLGS
jgi:hypothetical protein